MRMSKEALDAMTEGKEITITAENLLMIVQVKHVFFTGDIDE